MNHSTILLQIEEMSWKKSSSNNSIINLPTQEQILQEIEEEQEQIKEIQQQRTFAVKLQQSFHKKQQEIIYLHTLIDKYKPYYEKYSQMKLDLIQKDANLKNITKENQLLRKQFDHLLKDCEQLNLKLRTTELEKQILIRERHSFERVNRQIQQIFKEYQVQCRNRQKELISELQNIQIQMINMKVKYEEQSKQIPTTTQIQQVQKIQEQLSQKEKQVQKIRVLNSQLSIEYDKSVNKICQFQKQLNNYRMENHQLKKTLGLVIEQEKYKKLHEKYFIDKNRSNKKVKSQEDESEEEDSSLVMGESSPEMSQET